MSSSVFAISGLCSGVELNSCLKDCVYVYVFILLKKTKLTLFFYSSFRFTAKLCRKHRVLLYSLLFNSPTALPTIKIPHLSGTFVTIKELTLRHHYHPKLIVYFRFTLGIIYSMSLDKCVMT